MKCTCEKKHLIATRRQSVKYVYYFANDKWFLSNPLLKSYVYSSQDDNTFYVSCMSCHKYWKENNITPIYSPATTNFKEITLDLDSTLISTDYVFEEPGADLVFKLGIYTYHVFKRPHLDIFIKELAKRFDKINIFTAATAEYTDQVMPLLNIPQEKLGFVKTSKDCVEGRPYGWMDRELLKDISNSLIIDDKQYVIRGHNNVVLEIPEYHYANKKDNELLKIISSLSLSETEISRPKNVNGHLFIFQLILDVDFNLMPWAVHELVLRDVPESRFNYIDNHGSFFVGNIDYEHYVKLINHLSPYIAPYKLLTEEEFDAQSKKRKLNDDF